MEEVCRQQSFFRFLLPTKASWRCGINVQIQPHDLMTPWGCRSQTSQSSSKGAWRRHHLHCQNPKRPTRPIRDECWHQRLRKVATSKEKDEAEWNDWFDCWHLLFLFLFLLFLVFFVSLLLLRCLECGFVKITDDLTCLRYCWPAPNAPHRALWFPAIAVAVIEGTKAATSINWLEEGLRPHHWINGITLAEQIWYKEITKGANAMITQMCDMHIHYAA